MKAEWKIKGLYNADPDKVASEIESLPEENKAEQMVEKAKDENSAMHNLFEWDDTIAAQKYRVHQARQILCSIVIVREEPKEPTVRYFLNTGHQTYRPATKVVKDVDQYTRILAQAKRELLAFKTKYHNLLEFQELFRVIDEVV